MLVAASIVHLLVIPSLSLLPSIACPSGRSGKRRGFAASTARVPKGEEFCVCAGTGERHGDRILTRQRRAAPDGHGPCRETCRGARLPEPVAGGPFSSGDR